MEPSVVTSNICACGNKREETYSLNRRKEIRLIKILVVITCVACVTSVVSCVYTVITMNKYQQIRNKDEYLIKSKKINDKFMSSKLLQVIKQKVDESTTIGHTTKDKSNLIRHDDDRKRKRLRVSAYPTNNNNNPSLIYAAHYESMEIGQTGLGGGCMNKWNGTLCSNSTYWSSNKHQTVEFFVPSNWMKTSKHKPIIQNSTDRGNFKALHSGIYLLYLNMMIHANAVKHDVAVYINKERRLDCRETLDVVPTFDTLNRFKNTKSKTCSISGVFHINKGEIINIKIETRNTPVVLRKDGTNFGAILFAS